MILKRNDQVGFDSGRGTQSACLLLQVVEYRVLRTHLCAPYGIRDDRSRIRGPMGPSRRGHQPIVMIGRHQHELAPPMSCDFHRLTLRLMLELAELALKLLRRRLSHGFLEA
jgi:hypothetical protein